MMEVPEFHQQGECRIENREIVAAEDLTDCDLGLQVAHDGRIWLCVNGIAWIRFKPTRKAS